MKALKLYLGLAIILFFVQSCNNKQNPITKFPSSYELLGRDTINFTDVNGLKQGHWVVFFCVPQNNTQLTNSPPEKTGNETQKSLTNSGERWKMEEGPYEDNKKQGIWKYYSSEDAIINSVEYRDDKIVTN